MTRHFDHVITAIGQTTDPALGEYLKATFGQSSRIPVDEVSLQVPSHPRLFAGGDIVRGGGTVVQAVADGRKAASAIDRLLSRTC